MIDEPSAGEYYGGLVAAPVFSRVAEGTLRVLGIAPDAPGNKAQHLDENVPLIREEV